MITPDATPHGVTVILFRSAIDSSLIDVSRHA